MQLTKFAAGAMFPKLVVYNVDGIAIDISCPKEGHDWKMVLVYRGWHCPLCSKYLNDLEQYKDRLSKIGVDLAVVSGDSKEQLQEHLTRLDISFSIYYGLTIEQMQQLSLYISHPRSAEETDHPFPEPGLFVINENGAVQVVDISNNPFVRPELRLLVSGLEWTRRHNYPIRGTYV